MDLLLFSKTPSEAHPLSGTAGTLDRLRYVVPQVAVESVNLKNVAFNESRRALLTNETKNILVIVPPARRKIDFAQTTDHSNLIVYPVG